MKTNTYKEKMEKAFRKGLTVSLNGMSFRFKEALAESEDGNEVPCESICPLAHICENLPDPEFPEAKTSFCDFCESIEWNIAYPESEEDVDTLIPDMTKEEILEQFSKIQR